VELFRIEQGEGVELGNQLKPIRFSTLLQGSAKERDLEDLIVARPELLSWDRVQVNSPELLIIARQPRQSNRRRADLFAIDRKGRLVVVEVKRDVADEQGRGEALEFQAIRYAAAASTMSASQVVDHLARHLAIEGGSRRRETSPQWRGRAIEVLRSHLADTTEEISDSELIEQLEESLSDQRVFLVAADFDPDVLSACAWLRGKGVDVACFRLRPYRVGEEIVLQRERVIPPRELGEFFQSMAEVKKGRSRSKPRVKADSPVAIVNQDEEYGVVEVSRWREVLTVVANYALDQGLAELPAGLRAAATEEGLRAPAKLQNGQYVTTSFSAKDIRRHASTALTAIGCPAEQIEIRTEAGKTFRLPE